MKITNSGCRATYQEDEIGEQTNFSRDSGCEIATLHPPDGQVRQQTNLSGDGTCKIRK